MEFRLIGVDVKDANFPNLASWKGDYSRIAHLGSIAAMFERSPIIRRVVPKIITARIPKIRGVPRLVASRSETLSDAVPRTISFVVYASASRLASTKRA